MSDSIYFKSTEFALNPLSSVEIRTVASADGPEHQWFVLRDVLKRFVYLETDVAEMMASFSRSIEQETDHLFTSALSNGRRFRQSSIDLRYR